MEQPKVLSKEPRNVSAMSKEELWKKWVENPDTLVESEKIVWMELQGIIDDLLNELKVNNKTESSFTASEIVHVKKMLTTRNNIADNWSKITDTTDSWEINANFVSAIRKFNFTDVNYIYLLVELSIMNLITDSETFKTLLLFYLKDIKSYRATDLIKTLRAFAPVNYKRLEPYITNKFRNSLAHGTWAIENNQIVLFEDAQLIPFEKLNLLDFLLEVRKQNLYLSCLNGVLSDKIEKRFFG